MSRDTREVVLRRGVVVAAVASGLVLYLANLWLGGLNQDEGWYLYAALERAAGRLPYRDFFFSQGPLLPLVYGWLTPLWSWQGVLGGRVVTAVLGLSGAGVAAWLAGRQVAPGRRWAAAVTAWLLTAGNLYHAYFTTIPKTYALAGLLLLAGGAALLRALERGSLPAAATGGLLLALAAATRLSLGVLLPVAGLLLLRQIRRVRWLWLAFGLGGLLGLALTLGGALWQSCDQFLFANFFHTTRSGGGLLFAAGSLARLLRHHLPLAAVGLALLPLLQRCKSRQAAESESGRWLYKLLLPLFAAGFILHLLSPFPYDDYQTPLMPLLAVVVAVAFWRNLPLAAGREGDRQAALVALALLLGCGAAAAASPYCEEWLVLGKDRIWVVQKQESELARLRRTARELLPLVPAEAELLTQDTYLAVEMGRRVPAGFEMGPFAYFPALSDSEAHHYCVLNGKLLSEALSSSEAPVVALSGYALALAAPEMEPVAAKEIEQFKSLLQQRYRLERVVPHFGQGHTPLEIWRVK